jgi:hypothetical protein
MGSNPIALTNKINDLWQSLISVPNILREQDNGAFRVVTTSSNEPIPGIGRQGDELGVGGRDPLARTRRYSTVGRERSVISRRYVGGSPDTVLMADSFPFRSVCLAEKHGSHLNGSATF